MSGVPRGVRHIHNIFVHHTTDCYEKDSVERWEGMVLPSEGEDTLWSTTLVLVRFLGLCHMDASRRYVVVRMDFSESEDAAWIKTELKRNNLGHPPCSEFLIMRGRGQGWINRPEGSDQPSCIRISSPSSVILIFLDTMQAFTTQCDERSDDMAWVRHVQATCILMCILVSRRMLLV